MASWATLPHPLIATILRFTLHENDLPRWPRIAQEVCLSSSSSSSSRPLLPQVEDSVSRYGASFAFASVCRDWHAVLIQAASARALETLLIDVHGRPTRSSTLALRNRFLLQRARLRVVQVLEPLTFGLGDQQQQWRAVLSHAPHLADLLVSSSPLIPLDGVVSVIRAVTELRRRLQRLRLPTFHPYAMESPTSNFVSYRRRNTLYSRDRDLTDLVRATHACIETAHAATHGVGLKSLQLPLGTFMRNPIANADVYLDLVARCCPKIELLNGYRDWVVNYDPAFCREQWMVGLGTWRRFCSTCTQLTEFSWMCVPFATAYFGVFGETLKPKLTKLELVAPVWDWDRFKATVDGRTYAIVQETGYAVTTKNVHTILRVSPRLKELRVIWSYDTGGDGSATMNPEVFGDEFCSELAQHCKDLRSLTIASIPACVDPSVSIQQFTDKSMLVLATLPQLCDVSLGGCNITGDGLFKLVFGHAAETREQRVYDIRLGDCWRARSSTTALTFYTCLQRLLELLSAIDSTLPCGSRSVSLTLQNGNIHDMERPVSIQYLLRVQEFAKRVRLRHPHITMRGIVKGYRDTDASFERIDSFELSTGTSCSWRDAAESDDSGDEFQEDPIDDVFVSQSH